MRHLTLEEVLGLSRVTQCLLVCRCILDPFGGIMAAAIITAVDSLLNILDDKIAIVPVP